MTLSLLPLRYVISTCLTEITWVYQIEVTCSCPSLHIKESWVLTVGDDCLSAFRSLSVSVSGHSYLIAVPTFGSVVQTERFPGFGGTAGPWGNQPSYAFRLAECITQLLLFFTQLDIYGVRYKWRWKERKIERYFVRQSHRDPKAYMVEKHSKHKKQIKNRRVNWGNRREKWINLINEFARLIGQVTVLVIANQCL